MLYKCFLLLQLCPCYIPAYRHKYRGALKVFFTDPFRKRSQLILIEAVCNGAVLSRRGDHIITCSSCCNGVAVTAAELKNAH